MRRTRSLWWAGYGACAVLVLAALGFLSRTALELERATASAGSHARFQDRMRVALWRMDSLVLPLLAREGARPYFEYLAYYPQERAYNRFLTELQKGDVLTPSPLLNRAPEHVHLHFQIDATGTFTSPQVPRGNLLDLAISSCAPGAMLERRDGWLEKARERVPIEPVRQRVRDAEKGEEALSGQWLAPHPLPSAQFRAVAPDPGESQARQKTTYKSKRDAQSAADMLANAGGNNDAGSNLEFKPIEGGVTTVHVGTLIPLWLGAGEPDLFLFRRVDVGDVGFLQGVWLDWAALRTALIGEVAELLPECRLEPLTLTDVNWTGSEPSSLATIPVRLAAPEPPPAPAVNGGWRPVHGTLAVTWGATLAALVAAGFVLRAILQLGERRNRFASAVTHELRTPLTTFRMYSEMLADDMVREPAQRALYLQTLKEESTRLSTLVENVLAYARLEEGRGGARRERIALADLIARHRPVLERRARDGGLALEVVGEFGGEVGAADLETDVDAVGQVLFNLVDNACKYAKGSTPAALELSARVEPARVVLRVRDHGPGVDPATARQIFAPFDRGARNGDPAPGVGLGLALARGIAADLRGALTLGTADGSGACFELALPRAR